VKQLIAVVAAHRAGGPLAAAGGSRLLSTIAGTLKMPLKSCRAGITDHPNRCGKPGADWPLPTAAVHMNHRCLVQRVFYPSNTRMAVTAVIKLIARNAHHLHVIFTWRRRGWALSISPTTIPMGR